VSALIRVELPQGLCVLAGVGREVHVAVDGAVTQRTVLDALEAKYPLLRGTIRDQILPAPVAEGREVFMVVGAIAGG
jgi:hypothetical protein